MRRLGVLAIMVGALFVGTGCSSSDRIPSDCLEDQPCWDCGTMGNRVCGPE